MRWRKIAMLLVAALLVAALLVAAMPAQALASVSTADLTSYGPDADGTVVTIEGEAIGEALRAGTGHVWVNVLDDGTAVGVCLPAAEATKITRWGDWGTTGDRVRVSGVFNLACDQHGGDLDIHAGSIDVLSPGELREHPVEGWKVGVVVLGLAVVGVQFWFYRRLRDRAD